MPLPHDSLFRGSVTLVAVVGYTNSAPKCRHLAIVKRRTLCKVSRIHGVPRMAQLMVFGTLLSIRDPDRLISGAHWEVPDTRI